MYNAVINAIFQTPGTQEKEEDQYECVLVMKNCPFSFMNNEYLLASNGAGLAIDTSTLDCVSIRGEWIRVYESNLGEYGCTHTIEAIESGFRADGWELLTLEEGRTRYPWAFSL
jgi:hypothetical protein